MTPRARRSAGLLVYRRARARPQPLAGDPGIEVLVVHPGGPYWAHRDAGWWSIPKGELEEGEDEYGAARREFAEELGQRAPDGAAVPLGEVVQAGGKVVVAWAVEGDVDVGAIAGGTFEIEWPPRSGVSRSFPEVDRAAWCDPEEAKVRLLPGQAPFVDRLLVTLLGPTPDGGPRAG